MSRWVARIIGILMLLIFFLLFANLQRKLIEFKLQNPRPAPARTR